MQSCIAKTKNNLPCKLKVKYGNFCQIHRYCNDKNKIKNQKEELKILLNNQKELNNLEKKYNNLKQKYDILEEENKQLKLSMDEYQKKIYIYEDEKDIISKYEYYNLFIKYLHKMVYGTDYDWSIYNLCNNNIVNNICQHQLNISFTEFMTRYEKIRLTRNRLCHPFLLDNVELAIKKIQNSE